MKKSTLMAYALLLLVLAVLVYSVVGLLNSDSFGASGKNIKSVQYSSDNSNSASANQVNKATGSGFRTISTGSTDEGDVAVDLTPVEIKDGKLRVSIAANTHSVDLTQFDLKKLAVLEYNGKTASPSSADSLSGHHANGELVFDTGDVKEFTIRIKGIPKTEERVFAWP